MHDIDNLGSCCRFELHVSVLYFDKWTCLRVTGRGLTCKKLLQFATNIAVSMQRMTVFIVCTSAKAQWNNTPEKRVVQFGLKQPAGK